MQVAAVIKLRFVGKNSRADISQILRHVLLIIAVGYFGEFIERFFVQRIDVRGVIVPGVGLGGIVDGKFQIRESVCGRVVLLYSLIRNEFSQTGTDLIASKKFASADQNAVFVINGL